MEAARVGEEVWEGVFEEDGLGLGRGRAVGGRRGTIVDDEEFRGTNVEDTAGTVVVSCWEEVGAPNDGLKDATGTAEDTGGPVEEVDVSF